MRMHAAKIIIFFGNLYSASVLWHDDINDILS